MNTVPGAIWQPIDIGNRPKRIKGRGAVGHVAVSGASNLPPSGSVNTRSADWHFYLPKLGNPDGTVRFYQYIDLDYQCWATMYGNTTLPAWESEGGLGTAAEVNAEPWTGNQLRAAATIYAHLVKTEGAPLQLMPNSVPSSRGLASHRLGISPWRVPGGEVWSGSNGKLCPGDAKIAQLPLILLLAQEPKKGALMALTDAEQADLYRAVLHIEKIVGDAAYRQVGANKQLNEKLDKDIALDTPATPPTP